MPTSEVARVVLFVVCVGGVYVTACVMLIGVVCRRLLRLPSPSKKLVLFRRIIFGLAGAGALCIAYGYFIEPYWPAVTNVRIASPKLSAKTDLIRIVHISDLHCDRKPRLEPRLPALVAAECPDVIVFTGDCTNSPDGLPNFKRCLTELAIIAPTFVVKGNWDIWRRDVDLFGATGATELDGHAVELDIKGTAVWFAGAPARASDRIEAALTSFPDNALTVFLYHYPDVIYDVAARRVDLCFVGHTHGGQVALPFYGAVITRSKFGKRFESGLYRVEDTWLYVNRGIGMEGKIAPRVRFCARPEITVLEVTPN